MKLALPLQYARHKLRGLQVVLGLKPGIWPREAWLATDLVSCALLVLSCTAHVIVEAMTGLEPSNEEAQTPHSSKPGASDLKIIASTES